MKRTVICLGVALSLGLASLGRTADEPKSRGHRPLARPAAGRGRQGRRGDGQDGKQGVVTSLTNVTKPTLTVYRPSGEEHRRGRRVCPGGGYNNLAWDHEGEQVADWLNSIGVTAVVLKYRVPRREGTPKGEPPPQALMDAQRAVSLVRSKAPTGGSIRSGSASSASRPAATSSPGRPRAPTSAPTSRSTTPTRSTAGPTSPWPSTPAASSSGARASSRPRSASPRRRRRRSWSTPATTR